VILALRAAGVGDLATAVPALRGLRAAFPGEELAVAAPRWLAPLVAQVGGVDRLVETSGLGGGALPAASVAVNLHGCGPQSHRKLLASRPGRLLAYACPAAGFLDGPEWTDDEHEVRRWCRLLAFYGIGCDPDDLALARPAPDRVPVGATVLHAGAKAPGRRWPTARFALVARSLADAGHSVVVTGSAAERPLAERIAGAAGLPPTAVLAGHTDVGDLAAVIAHARLVVCGDTGAAHLATAYGIPSVLLFAGMSPAIWGPPADRPRHRVLWHEALAARAMPADDPHPALAAITVAEVLAAVDEVLATADGVARAAADPPGAAVLPSGG
jgi:ADP-heptose:LPS heptosyltransferase